jgi:transcriptional regulator with GAF, ATPase, and Fis domain
MSEDSLRTGKNQQLLETAPVFRRLAQIVYSGVDFDDVYQAVCSTAPDLVTGCDHASMMLVRDGQVVTAAASDDIARRIDAMERDLNEGPCLDAVHDDTAYIDSDLTVSSPWPRLAEQILAQTSVRGAAGFRLLVDNKKTGALNLFADRPGRLTTQSVNEAIMLASFVSVSLMAATRRQTARTLREGLESNREIGKAIGLMMAFHKVSDHEAFEILRKASQDMNIKIIDIAREVVAHHNTRGEDP